MPSPLVTVIIPTWNGRGLLTRCLEALAAQTYTDFQVLVVDNGSTDGTVEWIRSAYPSVHVIALSQNKGFATAINIGIKATRSPLVVTLNNDTIPLPTFLEELVTASEQFPEVGMFAATLLLSPFKVDAAGIYIDRLGVARQVGWQQSPAQLGSSPCPIFGPCAGAALYRRTLFEDVGLFDETYYAYLEDVELAWRARWAGWAAMWVPYARAYHEHSATGRRNLPYKFWLLGRNRIWTIRRHYPRPFFYAYFPLIALNELITGLGAALFIRHPAPLVGRLVGLRQLPPPLKSVRRIVPQAMFAQLTPRFRLF